MIIIVENFAASLPLDTLWPPRVCRQMLSVAVYGTCWLNRLGARDRFGDNPDQIICGRVYLFAGEWRHRKWRNCNNERRLSSSSAAFTSWWSVLRDDPDGCHGRPVAGRVSSRRDLRTRTRVDRHCRGYGRLLAETSSRPPTQRPSRTCSKLLLQSTSRQDLRFLLNCQKTPSALGGWHHPCSGGSSIQGGIFPPHWWSGNWL